MDSLAAIKMLMRVADSGSFSAAARQLDIAPSSVSRLISELEDDLGVRLFQRTTRKLNLTEAGQTYYAHGIKIVETFDEARLAVSQAGSASGVLRISSPTAIGREMLISVMPAFMAQYPNIEIVMNLSDRLVDLVEDRIDVAIRVGALKDSTLRARKIGASRRIICASPAYLKQHGRPESPKDLEAHNCITFRDHPGHNLWSFQDNIKIKASGNFMARSSDGVLAAALAGIGIVMMPDWNMLAELKNHSLEVILTDYDLSPVHSPIWAIHTHQRQVPAKVRVFTEFLIEHFKLVGTVT